MLIRYSSILPNHTLKLKAPNQPQSAGYIVTSATLCLSFSSKSKAINVFPILKLKARDQSIQARKKLFCHVILKNYLCNVLRTFLTKTESTRRCEIKEQAPQLTLLYHGRTVRSSHQRSSFRPARDPNLGASLLVLQNF